MFPFLGRRPKPNQGAALDPLKGILKNALKNPQNFSKSIWMEFEGYKAQYFIFRI